MTLRKQPPVFFTLRMNYSGLGNALSNLVITISAKTMKSASQAEISATGTWGYVIVGALLLMATTFVCLLLFAA